MKIYEYGKDILPNTPSVLAIGFFDGVHIAHRELIGKAAEEARRLSLPMGILTFGSEGDIKNGVLRIYSTEQRLSLFRELGVDFCVLCSFSDVRDMPAEEFCKSILIDSLSCRLCAVGFNFKFGKGALSDAEELSDIMSKFGSDTLIFAERKEGGVTVSSSAIRKMLDAGDMKSAAEMLGHPYFAEGFVTHGRGIGSSKLGVPTINVAFGENSLIPRLGVYTASVELDGALYPAVLNIGVCPTYDIRRVHIEAHLIDFSADLYGRFVKINFLSFLRDEKRFSDEKELKRQIKADILATIKENRGTK